MRHVREFFSFQIGYWKEIANGGTEGQCAYAFHSAMFMALEIGTEEEEQAQ
jgi:hypothetical protein